MEIKRMSSLERLMEALSDSDPHSQDMVRNAVHTVVEWWRKRKSIASIKRDICSVKSCIATCLETIQEIQSPSVYFLSAQTKLTTDVFVSSLSAFLNKLPRDPGLKSRNKFARSVRVISSAILISRFAENVLEFENVPDNGPEATECKLTALVLLFSLRRLFKACDAESLHEFRFAFVGYRFSVRNFLDSLDAWKAMDSERTRKNFEIAYMESYAMLLTARKMRDELDRKISDDSLTDRERYAVAKEATNAGEVVTTGEERINHFRSILKKLMNDERYSQRIEELEAYVQSTVDSSVLEMTLDEPPAAETVATDVSPSLHARTDHTSSQPPVVNLNQSVDISAASASSGPSSISTLPPSREELQLKRVTSLANISSNRVMYELLLDPAYKLPVPDTFSSTDASLNPKHISALMQSDPTAGAQALKQHMLRVMGDKMIASMTLSPLQSPSEVEEGKTYAVWYGSDSPSTRPVDLSPDSHGPSAGAFMQAKVKSVDIERAVMDVQYISDSVTESGVSINRLKLLSHGRDPVGGGFLSYLADIRDRIAAISPNKALQAEVQAALDLDLIRQMIENNAMDVSDLVGVLRTVATLIMNLQSPARKSEYMRWLTNYDDRCMSCIDLNALLPLLPQYFEEAMHRIDELHVEMANYYLSVLAPYAASSGRTMIRKSLQDQLELFSRQCSTSQDPRVMFSVHLPKTYAFLCDQLDTDRPENNGRYSLPADMVKFLAESANMHDVSAEDIGVTQEVDIALIARAFCIFLQTSIASSSQQVTDKFPETFLWDAGRLKFLRDSVDSLAVVSTLLITVRHYLLSLKVKLTVDQEFDFQSRLYELLRSDHLTMAHISAEAMGFVRTAIQNSSEMAVSQPCQSSNLPDGWEASLEKALKKCVSPSSPVLTLFTSRVYKIMARALTSNSYAELLAAYSMNSKSQVQQLRIVISHSKKLFDHNCSIFGPIYSQILRSKILYMIG